MKAFNFLSQPVSVVVLPLSCCVCHSPFHWGSSLPLADSSFAVPLAKDDARAVGDGARRRDELWFPRQVLPGAHCHFGCLLRSASVGRHSGGWLLDCGAWHKRSSGGGELLELSCLVCPLCRWCYLPTLPHSLQSTQPAPAFPAMFYALWLDWVATSRKSVTRVADASAAPAAAPAVVAAKVKKTQ